jgi:putative membrane protein
MGNVSQGLSKLANTRLFLPAVIHAAINQPSSQFAASQISEGANPMSNSKKHPVRGVLAGVAGGLVAAWVMNEFIAGPGKKLKQAVQTPEENQKDQQAEQNPQPDATMKTADAITATVTGGQHLTWEQEQSGGPIVHYVFAALMGGVYGGLAEYSSFVRSGFGTTFGSALFTGADMFAVPALHLAPPLAETPVETLATPFAAHLVYGATTELVRRLIRKAL